MRSTIIAAAFAATAIAVPLQEREVVYETDVKMVYVTQYQTVTANQAEPTRDSLNNHHHYALHPHWWHGPQQPDKGHTIYSPPDPPHTYQPQPQPEPSPDPPHTYQPQPQPPKPKPTTTWEAPEPAPTSEPPSEPAPSSPPSGGTDYQSIVLDHHNQHRANHSAPPLRWSSSLESTAQKIADKCVYGHDTDMDGGGYGQNIAAGIQSDEIARVISNMFYNSEIIDYERDSHNYSPQISSPSGFETWGHFSQVVWANTEEVACVTKQCGALGGVSGGVPPYFTVCNYAPGGNVRGGYAKNVGKALGHPTLSY